MPHSTLTEISSHSPRDTFRLGRRLGEAITTRSAVGLSGELGAGKTLFTKGLCAGLGVRHHERVNSPTFVIMQEYQGRLRIRHYDSYRLSGSEDLLALGFDEHLAAAESVVIVEWADRVADLLPSETLLITLEHGGSVLGGQGHSDSDPSADKIRPGPVESFRLLTFRGDPEIWADKVSTLAALGES